MINIQNGKIWHRFTVIQNKSVFVAATSDGELPLCDAYGCQLNYY